MLTQARGNEMIVYRVARVNEKAIHAGGGVF
jgi:hypothetical protein